MWQFRFLTESSTLVCRVSYFWMGRLYYKISMSMRNMQFQFLFQGFRWRFLVKVVGGKARVSLELAPFILGSESITLFKKKCCDSYIDLSSWWVMLVPRHSITHPSSVSTNFLSFSCFQIRWMLFSSFAKAMQSSTWYVSIDISLRKTHCSIEICLHPMPVRPSE